MKSLNEIFQWSSVERTVAFEKDGWFVYYSRNTPINKVPFISHGCSEGTGGWRKENHCQKCDEPVPEEIRTIYVLLQWSEQGYADPI